MEPNKADTVEAYIEAFPADVQAILLKLRSLVKEMAPEAVESISYAIPTYKLAKKPLIYFAAFKEHIGLYALPSGNEAFKDKFSQYKVGKGSIQFPLKQQIPFELIKEVIRFRIIEIERSAGD